jgi:hypothetical protein
VAKLLVFRSEQTLFVEKIVGSVLPLLMSLEKKEGLTDKCVEYFQISA